MAARKVGSKSSASVVSMANGSVPGDKLSAAGSNGAGRPSCIQHASMPRDQQGVKAAAGGRPWLTDVAIRHALTVMTSLRFLALAQAAQRQMRGSAAMRGHAETGAAPSMRSPGRSPRTCWAYSAGGHAFLLWQL